MFGRLIKKMVAKEIQTQIEDAEKRGAEEALKNFKDEGKVQELFDQYMSRLIDGIIEVKLNREKYDSHFPRYSGRHEGYVWLDFSRTFDEMLHTSENKGMEKAHRMLDSHIRDSAKEELLTFIKDPENLKAIISFINEYQVNSTGKV